MNPSTTNDKPHPEMKTPLLVAIAIFVVSLRLPADDVVPGGNINWKNLPVMQALLVYEDLTGAQLVTDSRVKKVPHALTLLANPTNKSEAAKVIEQTLLDQAGVVLTHLGEKRVSVTYNDALPINPSKKP